MKQSLGGPRYCVLFSVNAMPNYTVIVVEVFQVQNANKNEIESNKNRSKKKRPRMNL